jgi:hypothetical protein
MSLRLQLDPKLGTDTDDRLRRVLVDAARVTREIQAPPMLKVALEQADFALAATTPTLIEFDVSYHDTHGWWDRSAFRYTPKKAGYYLCSWCVTYVPLGSIVPWETRATMQETGTTMCETYNLSANGGLTYSTLAGSTIVYCNGAASYLELYAYSDVATDVSSVLGRTQLSIGYMGDNALR